MAKFESPTMVIHELRRQEMTEFLERHSYIDPSKISRSELPTNQFFPAWPDPVWLEVTYYKIRNHFLTYMNEKKNMII
jgi:hypothetical protein